MSNIIGDLNNIFKILLKNSHFLKKIDLGPSYLKSSYEKSEKPFASQVDANFCLLHTYTYSNLKKGLKEKFSRLSAFSSYMISILWSPILLHKNLQRLQDLLGIQGKKLDKIEILIWNGLDEVI